MLDVRDFRVADVQVFVELNDPVPGLFNGSSVVDQVVSDTAKRVEKHQVDSKSSLKDRASEVEAPTFCPKPC